MNDIKGLRARQIPMHMLPSKGIPYPEDVEIYVTPLTIRERRLLEGCTQAEYYRRLLEGVEIRGNAGFSKSKLIFNDVEFMDLARRIFTFEPDKKIIVDNYICFYCKNHNIKASFLFTDIDWEEFDKEVFGYDKTLTDEEGNETVVRVPGKEYTFSDGTTLIASPLTVGQYITMATKYLSNVPDDKANTVATEMYINNFAYSTREVKGEEFPDDKDRIEFVIDFLSGLYKPADSEVLNKMEEDLLKIVKPFKVDCPDCGKEAEVYLTPGLRFQQ